MKGQIEKILGIIWVLVPVLIIVGAHGGNMLELVEGGAKLEAQFSAIELASAINMVQAGPDGVINTYKLPTVSSPNCVRIYQTYVETSFSLLGGRSGTSELVERATFSADIDVPSGESISFDCTGEERSLVIVKDNGKVRISG